MLPENIIFIAALISFFGHLEYVRSVIKGDTKPNLVSWFIWMLAPFIGIFFQLKAGAGLSILPIFMSGFVSLLVLVAGLVTKNSIWKISTLDIVCGIFSLLALILYVLTHNLAVSILFAIASDALAFIPTLVKSWKSPESESHYAYSSEIIANLIGLLIITQWSFTIYSFGVYMLIFNTIQILILYRKKIFKIKV